MSLEQLSCPLAAAAARHPDTCALVEGPLSLSFSALDREVADLAGTLRAQGVETGQHLAVVSDDKGRVIRVLLACLRLGVLCLPLNPRQPPASLQQQVRQGDCHWLIDDSQEALLPGCHARRLDLDLVQRSAGEDEPLPGTALQPQRPCTGVFTSGSSGRPRLALHSYANHYWSALGSQSLIPLQPGDGWAASLPLYHIGGLAIVFRCLLAGATLIVPPADTALEDWLEDPRLSHLSAVPTQLLRFLQQGKTLQTTGLRYLLLGGSAFPAHLLDWLAQQPVSTLISYGLTEMSSQVVTGPLTPGARLTQLLPHRELHIAADGEILVRGATLFLGYYDQGRIERPLDAEGWFATRDLGCQDPKGLRIIGRRDNQFISGGENIQPEEIETLLRHYPGIDDCLVVPVPDPVYGQIPVGLLRTARMPDPPDTLIHWLKARLPGFKVPRHYLPLNPTLPAGRLKVDRRQLALEAERLLKGRTQSPGQPPATFKTRA